MRDCPDLLDQGHDVVVHAPSGERPTTAAALLDQGAAAVVDDLANQAQTRGVAEQVNGLGSMDAAIHNIGVYTTPAGQRRRYPRTSPPLRQVVDPARSLQRTLDAITGGPAFVRNGRMDLLAANQFARAFYDDVYATGRQQSNLAHFTFLHPASHAFTAAGTQPQTSASPSCAPKPAAIRTTKTSTTSSVSCPLAATLP
jgi:NAD(P)-dependent dehydrogenase (short-subunit alcohol dehydrogenase family)